MLTTEKQKEAFKNFDWKAKRNRGIGEQALMDDIVVEIRTLFPDISKVSTFHGVRVIIRSFKKVLFQRLLKLHEEGNYLLWAGIKVTPRQTKSFGKRFNLTLTDHLKEAIRGNVPRKRADGIKLTGEIKVYAKQFFTGIDNNK